MSDFNFLQPDAPPVPALRPVEVKPGQKPPLIDPATEYLELTPTEQKAAFPFSGHDFGGAIIRAAEILHGGEHALLFDACQRFHVEGTETTGAQHGTRTRGCTGFSLRRCKSHGNSIEGFINGGSHDGLLEDCDSWENGTSDKGHAFYLASYGSTNITGRRLRAWKCRGTAWQANGTPDELGPRKQKNITLEDSQAWQCGSQGTPAINVMSTDGFTVRNALIHDCNAGIALFDDYSHGADPWNVLLQNLTLYLPSGKYGLQVSQGSKNVTVAASILACQPGPVWQGKKPTISGKVLSFGADGWGSIGEALNVTTWQSRISGVGWSPASSSPS